MYNVFVEAIKPYFCSQDSRWSTEQCSQDAYSISAATFPQPCPFKDKRQDHCEGSGHMYDVGRNFGTHIKTNSPALVSQNSVNTTGTTIEATTCKYAPLPGVPLYPQCLPTAHPAGHLPANAATASSCMSHAFLPETVYHYMPPKHDQHEG